jgi:hypothetical protein
LRRPRPGSGAGSAGGGLGPKRPRSSTRRITVPGMVDRCKMAEKYPTDPVVEAYKRFRHLDRLIGEAGQGDDPYHKTCAALWMAVKQHCKRVGYAGLVED